MDYSMEIQPRMISDSGCHTGECPLWHADEGCLYWLDIPQSRLLRYNRETGVATEFSTGVPVGGFTLHEDGRLLLFMAEGAVRLWSEDGMETVIESLPQEHGNRFNDVIDDPEGRVFCGVMSTPERAGRLYRMDPDLSIHVMLEGTGTANGMGFSPDLRKMYFCDSRKRQISVFDYDRGTGALSNQAVLLSPPESEGKPDGMTVDAEGCIWSARWDGAQVVRLDPQGQVLKKYPFPVKQVSCVTFGGDDYTDLFATTAGAQDREANGELAGALFQLAPGVRGKAEFRSRFSR